MPLLMPHRPAVIETQGETRRSKQAKEKSPISLLFDPRYFIQSVAHFASQAIPFPILSYRKET